MTEVTEIVKKRPRNTRDNADVTTLYGNEKSKQLNKDVKDILSMMRK